MLLVIFTVCHVLQENVLHAAVLKPSLSKQDAVKHCSTIETTLLSYKDTKAGPSAPECLNQLGDGEPAWIERYARLSPFLSWQGCFYTTNNISSASMRVVATGA